MKVLTWEWSVSEDLTTIDLIFYESVPITSVDVERSFWMYKNRLRHSRRLFKLENIKNYLLNALLFK